MSNSQLESVADARRAEELRRLAVERQRVDRAIGMGVIGQNGTARPESQTAELRKVAAELDARRDRLAALSGDALIAEFVHER